MTCQLCRYYVINAHRQITKLISAVRSGHSRLRLPGSGIQQCHRHAAESYSFDISYLSANARHRRCRRKRDRITREGCGCIFITIDISDKSLGLRIIKTQNSRTRTDNRIINQKQLLLPNGERLINRHVDRKAQSPVCRVGSIDEERCAGGSAAAESSVGRRADFRRHKAQCAANRICAR